VLKTLNQLRFSKDQQLKKKNYSIIWRNLLQVWKPSAYITRDVIELSPSRIPFLLVSTGKHLKPLKKNNLYPSLCRLFLFWDTLLVLLEQSLIRSHDFQLFRIWTAGSRIEIIGFIQLCFICNYQNTCNVIQPSFRIISLVRGLERVHHVLQSMFNLFRIYYMTCHSKKNFKNVCQWK